MTSERVWDSIAGLADRAISIRRDLVACVTRKVDSSAINRASTVRTMTTGAVAAHAGDAVPTVNYGTERRIAMNPSRNTQQEPAFSLDGSGAADHDQPYRFGRRPTACAPYPFSTRQYARLLVLRGRVRDGEFYLDMVPEPVA